MVKNFKLIILIILLVVGAGFIANFFAREDIENLGETITGNTVEIPVESEPTKETLLLSLLAGAINFDEQMAKLRTEGFENNFFIATVSGVGTKNEKLTLELSFETGEGTETEEKIVSSDCPAENTKVISQEDLEIIKEKADIFEEASKDDLLISYCLDAACGSIGNECILIKFDAQ